MELSAKETKRLGIVNQEIWNCQQRKSRDIILLSAEGNQESVVHKWHTGYTLLSSTKSSKRMHNLPHNNIIIVIEAQEYNLILPQNLPKVECTHISHYRLLTKATRVNLLTRLLHVYNLKWYHCNLVSAPSPHIVDQQVWSYNTCSVCVAIHIYTYICRSTLGYLQYFIQ